LFAPALTRDSRAVALVFAAGYLPWPLVGSSVPGAGAGQRLAVLGADHHLDPGRRSAGSRAVRAGPASTLAADAVTFVVASALVFTLRGSYTARDSRPAGTIRGDIAEGLG
jgi:hypothetical protein